ncbi:YgaB-like protein [Bacillus sp. OV322]|uniref:YgaB family protein n=1 Tax=Bacillus sp. OV322 TaxID=1882764 RepID=UPI0008E71F1C|nr:YgaB family protein [Bacillus sp. OV322]SFC84976.1 YgaB-like protein [Bacillus sp. OV322]
MKEFDRLINEQLKTMEKLLFIQSEIERCQEIEQQLRALQELTELDCIQDEILRMKQELSAIHEMFEQQTEEVIRYYQEGQAAII